MKETERIIELGGMCWCRDIPFELPSMGDSIKAVFILKSNLASIIWNALSTFENNPATLSEVAAILTDQSVDGISIDDLLQVKNFADGCKKLIELVCAERLKLNIETACLLHNFVGREEALEWGVIRSSNVTIRGTGYIPPSAEVLPMLAESGFQFLVNEVKNPVERAIATFLFMSRSQFFFDANKRTSLLMMNGILLQNGYYPLTVLKKGSEIFYDKLARFYETGDASEMMKFFADLSGKLYPVN